MTEPARESKDYRLARLQDLLRERYDFLSLLGRGGAAAVYEVKNLNLGRVEALKVLSEEHAADIAARFEQEARIAASLDQPNIVKIYDYGQSEDIIWYSMQFVDGPTLSALLRKVGRMDPEAVARVAVPVLDALDYSHRKGVVHRDIKPANILVDKGGRPLLADFGVAKFAEGTFKTRTGLVVGTPAYVAPEQARGEAVDARADLYALGVMLYQMLTGGFPFPGETDLQSVVKRLTVDPQPILERREDVPREIAGVVMRALARDREERHPSALAMRVALVAACEELGILWNHPLSNLPWVGAAKKPLPSRPVPVVFTSDESQSATPTLTVQRQGEVPAEPAPALPRRRKWLPALGAAALVLLVIALAYATSPLWRPRTAPRPPAAAKEEPNPSGSPAVPVTAGLPPGGKAPAGPSTTPAGPPAATTEDPGRARPPAPEGTSAKPGEPPRTIRRAVTYAQLEESYKPDPPEGAPAACAGKMLRISVRVGEDGLVKEAKLLEKADPPCEKAALDAVSRFKFKPALDMDGRPVEAPTAVSVEFPEAP